MSPRRNDFPVSQRAELRSSDAVEYARAVSKRTAVGIYLLDQADFEALRESPMSIARLLRVRAEEMLDAGRPGMYSR